MPNQNTRCTSTSSSATPGSTQNAVYSNGKIKPNIIIIYKGREQEHPDGTYYVNQCGKWVNAGQDAPEAQRFRARLLDRMECERP